MLHRALMSAIMCIPLLGCRPATQTLPRFLDQTARKDLDTASLVVAGVAESVSPAGADRGTSGYEPIAVTLSVQRVLKGTLASDRLCLVYFRPSPRKP